MKMCQTNSGLDDHLPVLSNPDHRSQFAINKVLIKNKYAGLNFIDTYHRSGLYPRDLPCALGQEGAGVIAAVTPKVAQTRF